MNQGEICWQGSVKWRQGKIKTWKRYFAELVKMSADAGTEKRRPEGTFRLYVAGGLPLIEAPNPIKTIHFVGTPIAIVGPAGHYLRMVFEEKYTDNPNLFHVSYRLKIEEEQSRKDLVKAINSFSCSQGHTRKVSDQSSQTVHNANNITCERLIETLLPNEESHVETSMTPLSHNYSSIPTSPRYSLTVVERDCEEINNFSATKTKDTISGTKALVPTNEYHNSNVANPTPYVRDFLYDDINNRLDGEKKQHILLTFARQFWERPNLELSKISLPAFVFEPKSFLEKLTEPFFHANLMSESNLESSPLKRILNMAKLHFATLYTQQTRLIKKTFNPVLGEIHRGYWQMPSGSKTYFIGENVSHHPPVQACYGINRQDGFSYRANVEIEPRMHSANAVTAKFVGHSVIKLFSNDEEYKMNCPDGLGSNVLMGTYVFEFIGNTYISCPKTGYKIEIDFKQRNPWKLWQPDCTHCVHGTVTHDGELVGTLDGKWNDIVYYTSMHACASTKRGSTGLKSEVFWDSKEEFAKRLPYYIAEPKAQMNKESRKVWGKVSDALLKKNERLANECKLEVERHERNQKRLNEERGEHYTPIYFERDNDGFYSYKFKDETQWNVEVDDYQYEQDGVIKTMCKFNATSSSLMGDEDSEFTEHTPSHSTQCTVNSRHINSTEKIMERLHENTSVEMAEGDISRKLQSIEAKVRLENESHNKRESLRGEVSGTSMVNNGQISRNDVSLNQITDELDTIGQKVKELLDKFEHLDESIAELKLEKAENQSSYASKKQFAMIGILCAINIVLFCVLAHILNLAYVR